MTARASQRSRGSESSAVRAWWPADLDGADRVGHAGELPDGPAGAVLDEPSDGQDSEDDLQRLGGHAERAQPPAQYLVQQMDTYDGVIGLVRNRMASIDGNQPGDPAKVAQAIITALHTRTGHFS
jgi:hypothetical protein